MNKGLTKTITHFRRKLGMDRRFHRTLLRIEGGFRKRTKDVDAIYDLSDFLGLLQIAEYSRLGKTRSVIWAFKLGYLQGEEDIKKRIFNHFESEVAENE